MKIDQFLKKIKTLKRVAITPEIAKKYLANGFEVTLSEKYGDHLGLKIKNI